MQDLEGEEKEALREVVSPWQSLLQKLVYSPRNMKGGGRSWEMLSTHSVAHTIFISGSTRSNMLFWSPWTWHSPLCTYLLLPHLKKLPETVAAPISFLHLLELLEISMDCLAHLQCSGLRS